MRQKLTEYVLIYDLKDQGYKMSRNELNLREF